MFKKRENKTHSNYDKMLLEQLTLLEESKLKPVLWNDNSKMYCQPVVLNGYQSLSIVLTGLLNINTIEGCKLTLVSKTDELSRMSDSEIIKGEYSEVAKIGLTSFDIDLDQELIDFIHNNEIVSVKVETRNGQFRKKRLSFEFDNVNQDGLQTMAVFQEEEE